jgi:nitrite reductase/ring-hydroxylating ferredoxin subunit
MTDRYEVCPVKELPPGESKIIEIKGSQHSIGVFNVDGKFHALSNICPHQLAPLCEGKITGKIVSDKVGEYDLIREGEIIQCPWHGWKFDIKSGCSVFNPNELRTRTYDTAVESSRERAKTSCKASLEGEKPPIDKFETEIEDELVVVYA